MSHLARGDTPPSICSVCGQLIDHDQFHQLSKVSKYMRDHQMCFECAFWHTLAIQNPRTYEVLGGQLYPILNESLHRQNAWRIATQIPVLTPDHVVKILSTTALYGEVPQRLQHLFPDSCQQVDPSLYRKIDKMGDFRCRAKGCWDRQHCFWFNPQYEIDWNVVPKKHQPGDEHCGMFLNKNTLYSPLNLPNDEDGF